MTTPPTTAITTPPTTAITTATTAAIGNAVAVALLLVPGIVVFGQLFGGVEGYVAAGGGVLLGLIVAVLATRLRWAPASTAAAAAVAYLLFGGALALRRTTIAGFVPTPDTLLRLVPLSVQSWRDLLTVSAPVTNFVGPAVMPYLAGLIGAVVAGRLAQHATRYLWALLPTALFLVVAILWGLDYAPQAAFVGVGYGVVALLWATWRRVNQHREQGDEILVGGKRTPETRRLAGAAGLVAAGAALALAASPLVGLGADRQVLRQVVQPPLNLTDYASPLTSYRYLEVEAKNATLFTVTGLPAGARVRLATLDAYDGHVYNVADASAGFLRIGERVGASRAGTPASLGITIKDYTGVWLPGGGDVRGLTFTGANAQSQADSLYYNAYGGTLVSTAGVASGDSYTVDVVLPGKAEDASAGAVSKASEPTLDRVPEIVGKLATEYAGDAPTPLAQLRAIEKALQDNGYYSDGSGGTSRSGHSNERVASMLSADVMIGDDEQYAVAMALMARQLGIPARVVMGFYPKAAAAGTLDVTGEMAHVWVEVPFEGAGWLSFDPTPTRSPLSQVPQKKKVPKPQVLPPPDPPVNKLNDPLDVPGKEIAPEPPKPSDLWLKVALYAGIGLGAAALVSSPFVVIGALKRRRRNRRRTAADVAARFSGAWNEIVDAATDLGLKTAPVATRVEASAPIAERFPAADPRRIAAVADAGVFGAAPPSAAWASALWTDVDAGLAAMRGSVGRWRRIRAFCSLRSFGRPRLPHLRRPTLDLSGALRLGRKARA